jgi:lipopolysaccharide biosynthesis glycosyltransferase
MSIAFSINRLALIGLGVTLKSLLENCSNPKILNFYFLCADLNLDDKKNINELLQQYGNTNGVFIDFNAIEHFGNYNSLHGDYTCYGRLLLADYILSDRVLYLDADLVIELDVLAIEFLDFQSKAIAAVKGGLIKFSLENDFFCNEIGLNPELAAFNSGILLLNLKMWREKNIKSQCLNFASSYPTKITGDETILNALFAGNFAYLPEQFNTAWYANINRPINKKAILHFVGSPKPWDIFGRYFHKGFPVWYSYLDAEWKKKYYKWTYGEFLRVWHIRRSYARLFIIKIKLNAS